MSVGVRRRQPNAFGVLTCVVLVGKLSDCIALSDVLEVEGYVHKREHCIALHCIVFSCCPFALTWQLRLVADSSGTSAGTAPTATILAACATQSMTQRGTAWHSTTQHTLSPLFGSGTL